MFGAFSNFYNVQGSTGVMYGNVLRGVPSGAPALLAVVINYVWVGTESADY